MGFPLSSNVFLVFVNYVILSVCAFPACIWPSNPADASEQGEAAGAVRATRSRRKDEGFGGRSAGIIRVDTLANGVWSCSLV